MEEKRGRGRKPAWADTRQDMRMYGGINNCRLFLDLPQLEETPKTCLKCGKIFLSEGKHNRLCDPCNGVGVTLDGPGVGECSCDFKRFKMTPKEGS